MNAPRCGCPWGRERYRPLPHFLRLALPADAGNEPGGRAPFRLGSRCPLRFALMPGSVTSPHCRQCQPEKQPAEFPTSVNSVVTMKPRQRGQFTDRSLRVGGPSTFDTKACRIAARRWRQSSGDWGIDRAGKSRDAREIGQSAGLSTSYESVPQMQAYQHTLLFDTKQAVIRDQTELESGRSMGNGPWSLAGLFCD